MVTAEDAKKKKSLYAYQTPNYILLQNTVIKKHAYYIISFEKCLDNYFNTAAFIYNPLYLILGT